MSFTKQEALLKKVTTYQSPMPDVGYTYVPTSEISVENAVNGKPYWVERKVGEDTKPKKWIITDCSIKYHLRDQHPEDLRLFYKFILNQGIECYVWTGQLTKVSNIQSLILAMKKVESIDPDFLRAHLAKQNISKNESEIIDYPYAKALRTALTPLIPGMHEQYNVIDTEYVSPEDRSFILKGLKNLTIEDLYRPSVVMTDTLTATQIQDLKKITVKDLYLLGTGGKDIISIPREVELLLEINNSTRLDKLLSDCSKNSRMVHGLTLSDSNFPIVKNGSFPDLKYLEIKDCKAITETQVTELLSKHTKLKSLKIINCPSIDDNFLSAGFIGKRHLQHIAELDRELSIATNHITTVRGSVKSGKLELVLESIQTLSPGEVSRDSLEKITELEFSDQAIIEEGQTKKSSHYKSKAPSKLSRFLNRSKPSWEHPSQVSTLDPDTGEDHLELHARQLFLPKDSRPIHPSQYRLTVQQDIEIGEQIKYKSKQYDIIPKDYETQSNLKELYEAKYKSSQDVFYGQITLAKGLNDWYPLPSLTPSDEILNISTNKELLLGYCKEQNLYYVKPVTPLKEPLNLQFLVKANFQPFIPTNKHIATIDFQTLAFNNQGQLINNVESQAILSQLRQLTMEEHIAALQHFCKRFKLKKLDPEPAEGVDTLNAILKNATGVCRHRTFVFMALANFMP